MLFPPNLGPEFMRVVKPIWESDQPDHIRLQMVWNILTTLQGLVLGHVLLGRIGNKVFAGPFRGMTLINDIMTRHFAPELLGTYEWEIHDALGSIMAKPYKHIVNIGCSFGYYSVGFALRMPDVIVHAYDIDPQAREQCRKMAEMNGVADRVIIGERFNGEDYAAFADDETLVFMDIEGAEQELLDPEAFPALKKMDVVVEMHDLITPQLSTTIPQRFAATHDTKVIPNASFVFPLEKIIGDTYPLGHFDNLIATWERRDGPTPFGIFTRK